MAVNNNMSAMDRLLSEVRSGQAKPASQSGTRAQTSSSPRSSNQSASDSTINSLQRRLAEADKRIADDNRSRKKSGIYNAVSAVGDYLPILESRRETLQERRDSIATDIEDIKRSRQEINKSGGYGKGGIGAAFQRGVGQAQSTQNALEALIGEVEQEDLEGIVAGRARVQNNARNKSEQDAYERFQAADGFLASAREIFTNPRLLTNVAIESVPSSLYSMVGGVVGGVGGAVAGTAVGGPAGTVIGGRVGGAAGSGVGSFATEYGSAMLETFERNGIDLDDPEALKAAIDDPKLMEEAKERGLRRGIAVAAFDALSVGLAGKLGGGQIARRVGGDVAEASAGRRAGAVLAGGSAETVSQGALGAGGEASAQLLADGRIVSPQDIVAEFAGELPTGAIEATVGTGAEYLRKDTANQSNAMEDEELAAALAARGEANPVREGGGLLEDQNAVALRGLGNISAGGMNYTPDQILDIARNNESNPRIADIMSQPVSDVTKVEQVARILNQEEVSRVEPEAVRRISGMIGGSTSVSNSRQMIGDELAKINPAVIAESPTLSAISQTLQSASSGKQFVSGLRNAVSNYQPTAPTGTLFARPERGGEGSVIMSQEDVANEAQREREAQQAFRLADVRQRRFDTATGELTQREDLRAGAPEPENQFFLNPAVYGEDLGGIAATIVGAEGGKVRIQYDSPTEVDGNGAPVIISEDVDPTAMFDRVVRGTPRMSQELAGDLRNPRRGTGTDLNPRQSVDRTSTRALVPTESGLPATISPTRMTGFEPNTDQMPVEQQAQNAQVNPQQERPVNLEGIVEGPNEISGPPATPRLQAPEVQTAPAEEAAPVEAEQEPAPKTPTQDDGGKVEKHVENIEDKILNDDRNGVVRYATKVHKEGLIDDAGLAEIKRMSKDKDMGAEDIGAELVGQLDTKRGDGGKRYSGRRETVRAPRKKASDVVRDTPLSKDKTPDSEEVSKPDIDYDAVIQDRLDKIAARGAQGKVVANRLRSLLKQNNYDVTQLYYAFQMGEVVSRVLPKNAKVDILFVPSITASDAKAAAASGVDLGEEAAGSYDAYKISPNGFRGLITLSLSDNVTGASRENAAHEAFHVIQDMLRAYDPDAFKLLNNSFRDDMRIDDLDPSILRKLKTLTTDGEGSVYDGLIASLGDTPLSRFEAQAVAFGALVDAKDRGVDMKGLKASFIRVVDFISDMLRGFRNIFRINGVESVAEIFEGYRTGKAQEDMTEAAPLMEGDQQIQYSGRKKPPYEHPSIGKQKINPPIAETSTIPFLYDNGKAKALQVPAERMGLKDTVQFIQNRTREALMARFGIDRITGPNPETDKYLKASIAAEAEAAILKEMATGNRSALDWYTKAIEDAITEASVIYPMLRDDDVAKRLSNSRGINSKEDARVMFTLALSITSQNMKVRDNARATTEQFDTFLETGRFDPSRKYGTKAPSITSNLALANYMLEKVFDGKAADLGQFLNTEFTVAELNALGRKVQDKDGLDKPPFKISGELASETVYGSAIFGPKIGNGFYQNLNQNFSPVTIDLWFMRLWGRLTGTLVGNDTAIEKQIAGLREAVEADAHPTTKVPDGYTERFDEATDAEVIGLGIELAADWERQYKVLQKQGMTSDEITEKGLKPEWAFKAVAIAGQLKPNDAPSSGAQRKWIRDVVAGSVKMLAQKGYNVTPADLQALVWYPEKDFVNLFKEGKLESNLNVSYDTAFAELAATRNSNATSANTDAGDRGSDGASRQGDGGRSSGQAAVAGDQDLAAGAVEEEGDQVRRTLTGEARQKLIDRGVMYSGVRRPANLNIGGKATKPSIRPNAPKFKTGPAVLGVDPMAERFPRLVNFYEKLVNRTRSVKQLTKNIDDFYNDKTNIDRAEQLMGSRAAYTTQEFHLNELKPVLKEIGKQGLSINEVETYMHNRHAAERNAIIRERNDAFKDGGSGINDAAAKSYLAALSPAKRNRLEAVAKKLDAITSGTLQVLQDSGIESAETIRNLRNAYKFYVPLFREGVDGGHALGTRGASVEGSPLKAAVGSSKPVNNILANIVTQREAAINRAEANRLGNTVFEAALDNKDQAFWMVIDPSTATLDQVRKQLAAMGMDPDLADDIFKSPTKRAYNKRTGNVDTIADTAFKRQPNVFATRVDGTDKFIVFNPDEKMATDIAAVLKNDDLPTLEGASAAFINNVGRVTRLWSQLRTQYMPEFGPVNFTRDIWGVMVNLTSTPLDGEQFKIMAKAPLYAKKLVRVIRATDSGEPTPAGSQEVADLFDRFEKAGGRTAIRESFFKNFDRDPKKLEAELQKAVKQLAAGKTSAPKVVIDYVTAWNDALENATRLATFKIAIDKGMTDAQAAEIAKNITVNFNQKGQWTREINSLYGFANASIASTDRNIKTMLGKAGKKILIGGVGLGVIQGLALAAAGYDEDDIPEWVKDHAFIIPLGLFVDTDKYVAIPMPYFYNMFPAIGRRMVDAARGQLSFGEFVGGTAKVMVNSVNPIAYGAGFIEFVSPSVFDMAVQYAANKDGLGRRIYNANFNDLNPSTGMSRARGDTTVMYAMYSKVAEVINDISGGDDYEVGSFSPTPEEIKFFVEQTLPPMQFLYRSTATLEKGSSGEQIEANDIAFVRRFYGEVGGKTAEGGKFYDNVKAVNELKKTVKLREENDQDTTEIFDENPKAELIDSVGSYYRDVSDLRRERRKMILEGAKPSETQKIDDDITALMTEFNDLIEEAEKR